VDSRENTFAARRRTALMLAAALAPVVLVVALRALGMVSLARLAVLGLAGIAAGALVLARPAYGALFMVFYVYAGLRFYLPGLASVGVMGLTAAAITVQILRGDRFRATDGLFWGATGVFFLLSLQSMLWAVDFDWWFRSFFRLVKTLLLATMIVQLIRSPGDLRGFGKWMFFGGVATVCLGAINIKLGLTGDATVIGGINLMRFSGTHDNPNYAAAMMLTTLPMGLFYLKHNRRPLAMVAGGLGVLILVTGVFATFSRAAIVAFAGIVFGVLVREIRSRRAGIAVILLLAIGLLFTPRYYWARVMTVTDIAQSMQHDWSFYLRYSALTEAWATFLRHPFTGVGLNNFPITSASAVFVRIGAHNMYVELLADLGVFGLLSFLGIQLSAVRHLWAGLRVGRGTEAPWLPDFSWYLALSLAAPLISGLFADIHLHYMLWIPVAMGVALGNVRRSLDTAPRGGLRKSI
jgi:O-antigen ligase